MREADVSLTDADFDAMGIDELLALGREAGLRDVEELACHGNGAIVQVDVARRYDEERLSALPYVDRWERVSETDDGYVYVVAFTAPDVPEGVAEEATELVGTCDPDVDERGATMSLTGPQEAIARTLREYERVGVVPDLHRLGENEGPDRPLDDLTDRQREVIQTAYDLGYYDVPREASTDDVAAALDLDPSTVAEHLQRAERNLLARLL